MASISIRCQHTSNFFSGNYSPPPDRNNAPVAPSSLAISRDFDVSKWKRWRICSSAASMKAIEKHRAIGSDDNNTSTRNNKATVVYEKLDKWMHSSVAEIVKNLKEAPLLVHVYDKDETTTALTTEKSVQVENWGAALEKWKKKEIPLPEGVIFVERLDEEDEEEKEQITRAWGVVVQGKEAECGPVCYLLKTSRVAGSGFGGMCCTHYCLMRVQSFRETALSQLKNCWLIQGQ
ncbi:uncharacterized protein LOC8276621 [Ricinus communis]|uniref:DUF7804 domain-containing protein n=1 Tax=Ricinus communis TaxID=3988 RepID=B9S4G4_RICCO|nr:uncharacterized protein LOC8276621 [Ricinus communis]EEF41592.1 conserved hypothetical protein [Ricinus communis]|eukprot:XP_002520883.1 uncharacterized protein LOC8276621 [Ricinus communis]